jgi:hypothetical protein
MHKQQMHHPPAASAHTTILERGGMIYSPLALSSMCDPKHLAGDEWHLYCERKIAGHHHWTYSRKK